MQFIYIALSKVKGQQEMQGDKTLNLNSFNSSAATGIGRNKPLSPLTLSINTDQTLRSNSPAASFVDSPARQAKLMNMIAEHLRLIRNAATEAEINSHWLTNGSVWMQGKKTTAQTYSQYADQLEALWQDLKSGKISVGAANAKFLSVMKEGDFEVHDSTEAVAGVADNIAWAFQQIKDLSATGFQQLFSHYVGEEFSFLGSIAYSSFLDFSQQVVEIAKETGRNVNDPYVLKLATEKVMGESFVNNVRKSLQHWATARFGKALPPELDRAFASGLTCAFAEMFSQIMGAFCEGKNPLSEIKLDQVILSFILGFVAGKLIHKLEKKGTTKEVSKEAPQSTNNNTKTSDTSKTSTDTSGKTDTTSKTTDTTPDQTSQTNSSSNTSNTGTNTNTSNSSTTNKTEIKTTDAKTSDTSASKQGSSDTQTQTNNTNANNGKAEIKVESKVPASSTAKPHNELVIEAIEGAADGFNGVTEQLYQDAKDNKIDFGSWEYVRDRLIGTFIQESLAEGVSTSGKHARSHSSSSAKAENQSVNENKSSAPEVKINPAARIPSAANNAVSANPLREVQEKNARQREIEERNNKIKPTNEIKPPEAETGTDQIPQNPSVSDQARVRKSAENSLGEIQAHLIYTAKDSSEAIKRILEKSGLLTANNQKLVTEWLTLVPSGQANLKQLQMILGLEDIKPNSEKQLITELRLADQRPKSIELPQGVFASVDYDLQPELVYAVFTDATSIRDPISLFSKLFLRSVYKGNMQSKTHAVAVYFDKADNNWKVFTMSPFGSGEKTLTDWSKSHERLGSKILFRSIGNADEHLDWNKIGSLRSLKPAYSFIKLMQLGFVEAFPNLMPSLRNLSKDLEPQDLICTEGVLAVLKDESPLLKKIEEKGLKKFLLLPDQLERLVLDLNQASAQTKKENTKQPPTNFVNQLREEAMKLAQENGLPLLGDPDPLLTSSDNKVRLQYHLKHQNVRDKRNEIVNASTIDQVYDGNDIFYVKWGFRTPELPINIGIGTTQLRDCGGLVVHKVQKGTHSAAHARHEAPIEDYVSYFRDINIQEDPTTKIYIIYGNSAQGYEVVDRMLRALIQIDPKLLSQVEFMNPNWRTPEIENLIQRIQKEEEKHTDELFAALQTRTDEASGFIFKDGQFYKPESTTVNFQPFLTTGKELNDGSTLKIQEADYQIEIPFRTNSQSQQVETVKDIQKKLAHDYNQPFLLKQLALGKGHLTETDVHKILNRLSLNYEETVNLAKEVENLLRALPAEYKEVFPLSWEEEIAAQENKILHNTQNLPIPPDIQALDAKGNGQIHSIKQTAFNPDSVKSQHILGIHLGFGWRGKPTKEEINNILSSSKDLSGYDLSEMDLRKIDLSKADLSYTNLGGSNLSQMDLTEANLTGANLEGANLFLAKVLNANFTNTSIANIKGFEATRGIETVNFTGAEPILQLPSNATYIPSRFQNPNRSRTGDYNERVNAPLLQRGLIAPQDSSFAKFHPLNLSLAKVGESNKLEGIPISKWSSHLSFEQVQTVIKNHLLHTIFHFEQDPLGAVSDFILLKAALEEYKVQTNLSNEEVKKLEKHMSQVFFQRLIFVVKKEERLGAIGNYYEGSPYEIQLASTPEIIQSLFPQDQYSIAAYNLIQEKYVPKVFSAESITNQANSCIDQISKMETFPSGYGDQNAETMVRFINQSLKQQTLSQTTPPDVQNFNNKTNISSIRKPEPTDKEPDIDPDSKMEFLSDFNLYDQNSWILLASGSRDSAVGFAESLTGLSIFDIGNTSTEDLAVALHSLVNNSNPNIPNDVTSIAIGLGHGIGSNWHFKNTELRVQDFVDEYGEPVYVIACEWSENANEHLNRFARFDMAEGKVVYPLIWNSENASNTVPKPTQSEPIAQKGISTSTLNPKEQRVAVALQDYFKA